MSAASKNPRRVAAGRLNRLKREGLTAEGRAQLSASARLHQPWRQATGPRTPAGKARSSANGRVRQSGTLSVRELRRELADVTDLIMQMRAAREPFTR